MGEDARGVQHRAGNFKKTAANAGIQITGCVTPRKPTLSAEEQENIKWWQELLDKYPNYLVVATTA